MTIFIQKLCLYVHVWLMPVHLIAATQQTMHVRVIHTDYDVTHHERNRMKSTNDILCAIQLPLMSCNDVLNIFSS